VAKINSIVKGKVGERELAHALNSLFQSSARRGKQFSGLEGEDVVGLDGVHIECKRVEKLNLQDAMKQSVRDAAEGKVPTVFHRRNRQPWLVTVRLEDLPALVSALHKLLVVEGSDVGARIEDRVADGYGGVGYAGS
jgi:hypothetical protein